MEVWDGQTGDKSTAVHGSHIDRFDAACGEDVTGSHSLGDTHHASEFVARPDWDDPKHDFTISDHVDHFANGLIVTEHHNCLDSPLDLVADHLLGVAKQGEARNLSCDAKVGEAILNFQKLTFITLILLNVFVV